MENRARMAGDRLHLVDGHGRQHAGPQVHQPPQGGQVGRLVVDRPGVLLEHLVALGPGGVLQLEHGLGVEEVDLAFPAPLVLAADLPLAVGQLGGPVQMGEPVAAGHLLGQDVEARPRRSATRCR